MRPPNPNYVTPEEKDKRRQENLCVKCGAPDHMMRACENGYSKERLPRNGYKKKKEEEKKETAKKEVAKVAEEPESEESGKE